MRNINTFRILLRKLYVYKNMSAWAICKPWDFFGINVNHLAYLCIDFAFRPVRRPPSRLREKKWWKEK